eukprot:21111-Heterococcus_DN1.PRE.3
MAATPPRQRGMRSQSCTPSRLPAYSNAEDEKYAAEQQQGVSGPLAFWAHAVPALLVLCVGATVNGGKKYVRLRLAGDCGSLWADVYGA